MKVVNEGKWKNPWTMEVVCSNPACQATLLVEEKDIEVGGYKYQLAEKYYTHCVVCEKRVDLDPSKISERVKRLAENKRPSEPCPHN